MIDQIETNTTAYNIIESWLKANAIELADGGMPPSQKGESSHPILEEIHVQDEKAANSLVSRLEQATAVYTRGVRRVGGHVFAYVYVYDSEPISV